MKYSYTVLVFLLMCIFCNKYCKERGIILVNELFCLIYAWLLSELSPKVCIPQLASLSATALTLRLLCRIYY